MQACCLTDLQKSHILQEIQSKVLHKFSLLKPKPVDVCINVDLFKTRQFYCTKKLDGFRCFVYFRICMFQTYHFLQIYVIDSKLNVQFICNQNIKPTELKSMLLDGEKVKNIIHLFGIHKSNLNLIQQLGFIQLFLNEMELSKLNIEFKMKQFYDTIVSAKQSYKNEEDDGLVLTSMNNESYKYKPIDKITTDFRLNIADNQVYLTLDDSKAVYNVEFQDCDLYEDGDIVECNTNKKITILKKRVDKTKSNSTYVFKRNLDLIHCNIKEKEIQQALNDFKNKYWASKKKLLPQEQQLKRFHNVVVKDYVFKTLFDGAPKLYHYEIAGGQGGDLWRLNKYCESSLLFLDIDGIALNEAKTRYKKSFKKDLKTYQIDLNNNDDLKELLDDFPLPSTISCQFAVHYFFDSFVTFCNNLDIGGRCAFTLLDKDKVVEFLSKNKTGEIKVKKKTIFSITHQQNNLYKIFVNSIGKYHSERVFSKREVYDHFSNFKLLEEFNFADRFPDQKHPLMEISNLYHAYIFEKEYSLKNQNEYSDISDDDYY